MILHLIVQAESENLVVKGLNFQLTEMILLILWKLST